MCKNLYGNNGSGVKTFTGNNGSGVKTFTGNNRSGVKTSTGNKWIVCGILCLTIIEGSTSSFSGKDADILMIE